MDAAFLKVLRIALTVLSDRLITFLALAMSFGLACWAMWGPTGERLIMAGFFAICVFLPALIKERKSEDQHNDD
jgi:hypothetical protein